MRGLVAGLNAVRPRTVDELLGELAAMPRPTLVAGGTDVMVRLEAGLPEGPRFIDMSALADSLRYIHVEPTHVELGALVTYWDTRLRRDLVEEFPLLEQAARTVGAVQIQGRGTWAGNIANGSPAADGVAALLALDAEVVLQGRSGRRTWPLHGFFSGYKTTAMTPDEFIAAVRLPRGRADRWFAFHKIGTRRAQAITKVGLTLRAAADGTHRVVGTSLAPFVIRYTAIEELLDHSGAVDPAALAAIVQRNVKPIDDIRSTAAWRRAVFHRLLLSELKDHERLG